MLNKILSSEFCPTLCRYATHVDSYYLTIVCNSMQFSRISITRTYHTTRSHSIKGTPFRYL